MFSHPLVDFLQRFTVLTRQMPLGCSIMIPPHCLSAQKIVEGAGNFSSLPTNKFFHWYLPGQCHPQNELWRGFQVALLSPECEKWITTAQPCKDNVKAEKLQLQPRPACLGITFPLFGIKGKSKSKVWVLQCHSLLCGPCIGNLSNLFFSSRVFYPILPVWKDLFKPSKNYTL